MPALRVVASPLSADLLRIALAHRGVSPDVLTVHCLPSSIRADHEPSASAVDSDDLEPAAVCLQPGGLRAFHEMGLDVEALAAQGTVVTALRVLHPRGHRVARLDLSGLSLAYPMLVIATPLLRTYLASAVQAGGAHSAFDAPALPRQDPGDYSPGAWKLPRCPGVLIRTFRGSFRFSQEPLLWDHKRAYVCVGQLPNQRVVLSAMSLLNTPAPRQRDACQAVLDDVVDRLGEHFHTIDELVDERWFRLAGVGARACWDGRRLLWGSAALQLHPVAGMSISYWAIQANRLAEELSRKGRVSRGFLHDLDARNRRMVRRNLLSVYFHLRPTWMRRLGYWPAAWSLQRCSGFRRAAIRRLWLC